MEAKLEVTRAKESLFFNCNQGKNSGEFVSVPYILMVNIRVDGIGDLKEGDIAYSCPCPKEYENKFSYGIWLKGKNHSGFILKRLRG